MASEEHVFADADRLGDVVVHRGLDDAEHGAVVEGLNLRPLMGPQCLLNRKRMESELGAECIEFRASGVGHIYPYETGRFRGGFKGLFELDRCWQACPVNVQADVGDHGTESSVTRMHTKVTFYLAIAA